MAEYNIGALQDVFRQIIGREANSSELQFLKPLIEKNYISPYEVGQYLGGTPEAQQTRLQSQGKQYSDLLAGSDQNILNQAANTAQGQFAQQGRPFSTGQGNAVLQAGQNLAMGRQEALANFYGRGFGDLNAAYGQAGANQLPRAYGLGDEARQRQYQMEDYNRMQNDYNNYLNAANRQGRQRAIGSAIGGLAGAGIGGYFGGSMGAGVGASTGSRIGGIFG